jgi:hypothetical protein
MNTINKNKLFETDYVLWDKVNDTLAYFIGDGSIVIYGDIEEAKEDCSKNECVVKCTELPIYHQEKLLNQINK